MHGGLVEKVKPVYSHFLIAQIFYIEVVFPCPRDKFPFIKVAIFCGGRRREFIVWSRESEVCGGWGYVIFLNLYFFKTQ